MESIDKPTVQLLAGLLKAYGVRRAVVSPGSRCAPVTVALSRSGDFALQTVIDERSAAFVGLGMALATGEPVALVCTSGTAPLNYAPALAEAYYRRVPLIAVTADRPADLVDQRDSQTIRQAHALDAVVRHSVDIADERSPRYLRLANRLMNEVIAAAVGRIPGPVHINMQLDAPLTPLAEVTVPAECRRIFAETPVAGYDFAAVLAGIEPSARVLVVAGDLAPDPCLNDVLHRLARDGKAVVFAEAQSNLRGFISDFPKGLSFDTREKPDIVVSIGGSLVSGRLKAWLRRQHGIRHISVGADDCLVDTFFALDTALDCEPAAFFEALDGHLAPQTAFVAAWRQALAAAPRTGVAAELQRLVDAMPGADFHFSNGSSVRYAQLLDFPAAARVECNRGVSGIDGSTSTAIGYAMASERPVLFVSGDMSASYDLAAFALRGVPDSFKMVVLDNGGGDIFRAVGTTRDLAECESFFVAPPRFPLEALAAAYGFAYYTEIDTFVKHTGSPAVLHLKVAAGDAKKLF